MQTAVSTPDEADLAQLTNVALTGVLVGAGSIVLEMENGSSIVVQCPFEVIGSSGAVPGHGESHQTADLLFPFLNQTISKASLGKQGTLELHFGSRRQLKILPDHGGFESYVLRTSRGTVPVY